jgi:RES domain-containing protein
VENLAVRLANLTPTDEVGEWMRHVSAKHARSATEGSARMGRWGTNGGFPVLYLGRPRDSVIVEAYRHLVDPVEFDTDADRLQFLQAMMPRTMIRCSVDVTNLLDLRTATGRSHAGLTIQDLTCATTDRDAYARCQHVAQVAHQLRLHGVIAPAATGLGETLALFTDVLPEAQIPSVLEDEPWHRLPGDPRAAPQQTLRLVRSPRLD